VGVRVGVALWAATPVGVADGALLEICGSVAGTNGVPVAVAAMAPSTDTALPVALTPSEALMLTLPAATLVGTMTVALKLPSPLLTIGEPSAEATG
jgi:hypothetical protein